MKNWYCIYTKPKMEEMVGSRLSHLPDIEIFQPKLKKNAFRRGRWNEKTEHLFPSYLFSRFSPSAYGHLIAYTRGVKRILGDASGHPCIVEDHLIDQIKARLQDGFIRLEMPEYKTGDKVRIQHGPLAGFTGVFQEAKARDRVLLLLNALNYSARLEVEKQYLAQL